MTASADLMTAVLELDQAWPAYDEAREFYEGSSLEKFASPQLARMLSGTAGAYKLNFAKTPVDVVAERLEIVSVTVAATTMSDDDGDGDDDRDDALTADLEARFMKPNKLNFFFKDLFAKVSEFGDGYAFLWPELDTAGNPTGLIKAYYNPATTTRAVYDDSDPNTPLYVIKSWWTQDPATKVKRRRAVLYYPDRIESWITLDEKGDQPDRWVRYAADGVASTVPNPFGRLTCFHFRNASPYGKPEHKDGYGAQRAIDKTSVTLMTSTEYSGFPQRYALSDPNAVFNGRAIDSPAWIDPLATGTDGNDDSRLVASPGELWTLDGVSQVGQFAVSDPKAFIEPLNFYIRSMAQVTNTPLHYFDPQFSRGEVASGASRREANAPLDEKVGDRQERLEDSTVAFYECALEMMGYAGRSVTITWKPKEIALDESEWATVTAKIACGVPQRQALIEAGYTADQVDDWLESDHEDMDITRRVQLLSQLSIGLMQLGQAEALGVLDSGFARNIADIILGQLSPEPPEANPMALPSADDPVLPTS